MCDTLSFLSLLQLCTIPWSKCGSRFSYWTFQLRRRLMVQWYRPPTVVVSIPLMYQYLIYDILLWNTCSRLEWQQSLTSLDTFTCQLILILVYLLRILNVCLDKDVDPLVLGELAIGVLAHGPQVLPLDLRAPFLLLLLAVVHQEPTHGDIYVPPSGL